MNRINQIEGLIKERILILDGAMGTAIQKLNLSEKDFRGNRFKDHPIDLQGNNDLLSITQPDHIKDIHAAYLKAGADLIETNTFNANGISMNEYQMSDLVYEMNLKSAELAVDAARYYSERTPEKPRFVVGSIGPSSKTLSISPEVEDPGFRAVTFDQVKEAYKPQINGLIDGGADLLLVETVFDTLNAKAVLIAIEELFDEKGVRLPIMLSFTIIDQSGRTLSGQTLDAFFYSMRHFDLFSIGINCSLGAKEIFPYIKQLSSIAPGYVSLHPNAGLPDQFGNYVESPELMGSYIREISESNLINIVGGCCGTTPEHIARISEVLSEIQSTARIPSPPITESVLTGLEVLKIDKQNNFINIGERTNVFGSRKFARLIKNGKYDKAVAIARNQVEAGAQVIDINMDDPLIDSEQAMVTFLNLIAAEPEISKYPIMIDSSHWEVLEAGLKCIQGKAVINSISLKDGEDKFKSQARKAKRYGAAIVIMAFDEVGQATSYERKIEICKRSYDILVNDVQFPPEDIIFDANILTVATGMKEHNLYALNFIKAVQWIKENLPHARTSGGISNLSFSFRGNDMIREAIHSVFLFHSIKAGLDMGILNASSVQVYDDIPDPLVKLIETVLFEPTEEKIEELIAYASKNFEQKSEKTTIMEWRQESVEERLKYSIVHGIIEFIEEDIAETLKIHKDPVYIIEVLLMAGTKEVGDLFDSGKMFLPQVIKSARVMKNYVEILMPHILASGSESEQTKKSKVVLATVKGDVHDIGKNIISIVLSCNQFDIIDLGVMVPADKILTAAIEEKADIIALSGLITPSLGEMAIVAEEMERKGFTVPLLIGGATTSELHTAVKLAPLYSHPVIHIPDASKCVQVATQLMSSSESDDRQVLIDQVSSRYQSLRDEYSKKQDTTKYISISRARQNKAHKIWSDNASITKPSFLGSQILDQNDIDLDAVISLIDWGFFFLEWKIKGKYPEIFNDPEKGPEARKLYDDALILLEQIRNSDSLVLSGAIGFFPANSVADDIELYTDDSRMDTLTKLNFLRNQSEKQSDQPNRSLADYIAPKRSNISDYIGLFVLSADVDMSQFDPKSSGDEFQDLMIKMLCHRLVEAYAEWVHMQVREQHWGYEKKGPTELDAILKGKYRGIRPAPGYPPCPDHREKTKIFELLEVPTRLPIQLTENFAMDPAASVCGYYFSNPEARYFNVGKIGKDQAEDYAKRREEPLSETELWLKHILNYQA